MVEDDRTDRHRRADGGGAVGCVHLDPGSVHLDLMGPPRRAEARMAARYGGARRGPGVRPGRYVYLGGDRMDGGCDA